jgi:glycosidase
MGSRFAVVAVVALVAASPANAAIRLFHDTFNAQYRSPFGAVPAGSKVTLRLRVTGGKPSSVSVHAGGAFHAMRRSGTLWSYVLTTPATPQIVNYDFRVRFGGKTLWYGDDGTADVLLGGTGTTTTMELQPFTLTAYAPGFTTPAWAQGAVVYSIFPDRFRNGDPTNDYCRAGSTTGCPVFYGDRSAIGHAAWNGPVLSPPPWNVDFFGGDLEGVRQKLDYLRSLGVDAIWLNPIFKASSNHRYDTADYMHVDPALGGDPAFASLAGAAKVHGIHLILDGVFNHASSDSIYFDRYHRYSTQGACESTSSPYRSWFQISGGTPCTDNDYKGFAGLSEMPVFNHDDPGATSFLQSVAKTWLGAGADGWRLDAAQEIDHPWWRAFRTAVKASFPDAPLIAEDTAGPADATDFLLGNEMDGVMNYRFREDTNAFVMGGSPTQLAHALTVMAQEYPLQALAASLDLIDSHDTQRALSTYGGDKQRLRLAALLQFTYIGAPMILYGDEAAINAPGSDPFNRAPYPWTDASGDPGLYGPPDQSMIDWFSQLARVRHSLPALMSGGFKTLLTTSDVYAFVRSGGAAKPVIVALNRGTGASSAAIPVGGSYPNGTTLTDQLSGATVSVSGGKVNASVPGRSGLILVGS